VLLPLSTINWQSPLFWAVMIGWILSVTLHEFAHGIVAYWGGDYSIRKRGLLTLNPAKYVNPLMTFVLPVLFMAMGGVPLVGAATYVNTSLMRNKFWQSLSAAAGPLMNFVLFVACVAPLYPRFGWTGPQGTGDEWMPPQIFCGAMAVLQFFACVINLIPVPPLDGFNILRPYLRKGLGDKLMEPQVAMGVMLLLFFVMSSGVVWVIFIQALIAVLKLMGVDEATRIGILRAYNVALFGVG
jgi:Zn-dependent protease